MMYSFWRPTAAGAQTEPGTAKGMNAAEKIVFSTTLEKADWNNTRVVKENIAEEVKKWKDAGMNMMILGSGSIISQLTDAQLIDTYMIMLNLIALSRGTLIFNGINANLPLLLTDHRVFKSGRVLLTYKPIYH